jgi:phage baseplate assembly protein V
VGIRADVLEQLQRLIRPLQVRVANSIARAVVNLVDNDKKLQLLQLGVLEGEDIDDAERFQQFGFYSVPFPGAEAVVLFPNGDRAHALVVAVDDRRYRPTGGDPGEVAIYNHVAGTRIGFTADGDAAVFAASGRETFLGGASAVDGVIKGTTRDTAEQVFLTAMATFVAAIVDGTGAPSGAKATFTTAIGTFATAAAAAVSATVKTE